MKLTFRVRSAIATRATAILFAALLSCASAAAFQRPDSPIAEEQQQRVKILNPDSLSGVNLLRLPGRLLSESELRPPAGQLRLRVYRIEELDLPGSVDATIDGARVQLNQAYRITVFGGPFQVRNAPLMVWIDGKFAGMAQESSDLKSASAVTFDRSLLRNGATVALSYGPRSSESYSESPEKIQFTLKK